MKLFIDTNVFLDLILKRDGFKDTIAILDAIQKGLFEAVILDITLLNIDYIAKKQAADIREFLSLVNDTCIVTGATNSSIAKALAIDNSNLEDNLQYISAKSSKCAVIVTNDKSFYNADIQLLSSKNFVKRYLNPRETALI